MRARFWMAAVAAAAAVVLMAQDMARPVRPRKRRIGSGPGYESVRAPVEGRWFRLVNAQGDVPDAAVNEAARIFCGLFDLPLDYVAHGSSPAEGVEAGVEVVLDGEGSGPSLLVEPEGGRARVCVKALKADGPAADVLEARLKKELWRAGCYALGVGIEATPSVLRPIASPKDLDASEDLCSTPMIAPLIAAGAQSRGLGRMRYVSYRQACRAGWAPAPTHEAQRAFFEQMKADKERGPAKPITIPPPKK